MGGRGRRSLPDAAKRRPQQDGVEVLREAAAEVSLRVGVRGGPPLAAAAEEAAALGRGAGMASPTFQTSTPGTPCWEAGRLGSASVVPLLAVGVLFSGCFLSLAGRFQKGHPAKDAWEEMCTLVVRPVVHIPEGGHGAGLRGWQRSGPRH